jgi:hypothetical protein
MFLLRQAVRSQAVLSQTALRPQFSGVSVSYLSRTLSTSATDAAAGDALNASGAAAGSAEEQVVITHGGVPRPCLRVTTKPTSICPTKRPKGNSWNGPKISLRRQAIIRKKAIKNGL